LLIKFYLILILWFCLLKKIIYRSNFELPKIKLTKKKITKNALVSVWFIPPSLGTISIKFNSMILSLLKSLSLYIYAYFCLFFYIVSIYSLRINLNKTREIQNHRSQERLERQITLHWKYVHNIILSVSFWFLHTPFSLIPFFLHFHHNLYTSY
jgi:hypothetical protein